MALLVGILIATAACGAYRFPGPGSSTGNVHGQVLALGCGGPVQPQDPAAVPPCSVQPSFKCPAQPAIQTCGRWPLPGFELVFTNGGSNLVTKADPSGAYSIELPAGTWRVSAGNFGRIVEGPQTLVVIAGASIEADYFVDTGIRAAA
jgi:hypothetical protein